MDLEKYHYHKPGDIVPSPLGSRDNFTFICRGHDVHRSMDKYDRYILNYRRSCTHCDLYKSHYCYKNDKNSVFGPCNGSERPDGMDISWEINGDRDRSVGEMFTPRYGRIKVIVKESDLDNCHGCFYHRGKYGCKKPNSAGYCYSNHRLDGIRVIFEKVQINSPEIYDDDDILKIKIWKLKSIVCSMCPYECECTNGIEVSDSSCMYKNIINRCDK